MQRKGEGSNLFFMIFSWNIKGFNERDKLLKVWNLLREWKVGIVNLQETKLELVSRVVVRGLWGYQHVYLCYLGSRGAFGRILLMWVRKLVEKN